MTRRVPPLVMAPSRPSGRDRTPQRSLMTTSSAKEVARAWEDFAAGENIETGVRPEILASWYRCRDRYAVDHTLDIAPGGARTDEAGGSATTSFSPSSAGWRAGRPGGRT